MKKIAILPLDTRPCCYDFTENFGQFGVVEVLQPPKEIIGGFTYFGDQEKIITWLKEVAGEVDGMVIAVDQLAYGGLIPSRMTERTFEESEKLVEVIKEIRKDHPGILIYAVNVLMRISITTKNKQFTEYWSHVFEYSQLYYRKVRLKEAVGNKLKAVTANVPPEILEEYLQARERNHKMNMKMIRWASEGIIDYLAITQEDASDIGIHLLEQFELMKEIYRLNIQRKVLVYPGADEATQTLLARMVQYFSGRRLLIYPKYNSQAGRLLVAKFEDRPVDETVTSHITASGALVASCPEEADFILYVNTPLTGNLDGNIDTQLKGHFNSRHQLQAMIEQIDEDLKRGRAIALADISFPNASDLELMQLLFKEKLYFSLTSYSGWNTAGNSMGTCLSHAILHMLGKSEHKSKHKVGEGHISFMLERAMDEWAYQANVRGEVNKEIERELNLHSTNLEDSYEIVNAKVEQKMKPYFDKLFQHLQEWESSAEYIDTKYEAGSYKWKLPVCRLPWNRTFEVEVKTDL